MKNIKSFLIGFLSACLILVLMGNTSAMSVIYSSYTVYVNKDEVSLNSSPVNINGSVFLPLRDVGELLGFDVNYVSADRSIHLTNEEGGHRTQITEPSQTNINKKGSFVGGLSLMYLNENGKMNLDAIIAAIDDNEISVNDYDEQGNTLLHTSTDKDDYFTAKYLIENGADINSQNNEGYTPLHVAAINHNGSLADLLIELGATTQIEDKAGKLPIDHVETRSTMWKFLNIHKNK